jgi:hypothetical protein
MALPAKKYDREPSHLRIVKSEKAKRNNPLIVIGILLIIAVAIAIIPVFQNNIDDNPKSEILTESGIDWDNPPCSPNELNNDWIEVTPETMKQNSNRREYQNKKTGLKIAFDKGIPGKPKFKGKDHWHIYNPFSLSVRDYYLDKNGNKIHKNDDNSHIEIKCN